MKPDTDGTEALPHRQGFVVLARTDPHETAGDDAATDRIIAHPVAVVVVPRRCHRSPRRLEVAGMVGVGIIRSQEFALEAVGRQMLRQLADAGEGEPRAGEDRLAVDRVHDGAANVQIVERRHREIHLEGRDPVLLPGEDAPDERWVGSVPLPILRVDRESEVIEQEVELVALDLAGSSRASCFVGAFVQCEFDPIDVRAADPVRGRIPRRIPDEGRPAEVRLVPGHGLLLGGRDREVQVRRALEHVRPGRHEEALIVPVVAIGRALRDRRRRRHREQVRQIAFGPK